MPQMPGVFFQGIGVTLTFAGVIQTHMQRVVGERYMDVQDDLGLFFAMRLVAGVIVTIAVLMYIYAMLGPAREEVPAGAPHVAAGGRDKENK